MQDAAKRVPQAAVWPYTDAPPSGSSGGHSDTAINIQEETIVARNKSKGD